MIFGYMRVSTQEQCLNRQYDQLKEAGAEKIFEEKVSGRKYDRPELLKMIEMLRDGDVVLVTDLTRLSRSSKDLFQLVEQIQEKGADIRSLKENWLNTGSPHGKLLLTIFSGLSQFEVDLIRIRTKERPCFCKS